MSLGDVTRGKTMGRAIGKRGKRVNGGDAGGGGGEEEKEEDDE